MGKKNKRSPLVKEVLANTLQLITPTKKERLEKKKILNSVISTIRDAVKPARPVLGGSGAKDTFLAGQFDMDIFILYPYSRYKDRKDLSELVEGAISKKFSSVERIHGSRDYFRVRKEGVTFEIIPILEIKSSSQAKNITDVSPLHSKWVVRLAKKEMHSQIRLTKAFCRGQGVYGAESYIRGFSGYVCEILTIKYGSFLRLLSASKGWVPGETIDVAKKLRGRPVFSVLNKSKLLSPLIVIDPVQENRNAAAALDMEAYNLFRESAIKFLSNPSSSFFDRQFLGAVELKKKYKEPSVILKVNPINAKEDVAGTAMHKALEYLRRKAAEEGFKLKESSWEWDKKGLAYFWFIPKEKKLPATREHLGPPARMQKHAKIFKKRYRRRILKKGRIVAIVKREHRTLKSLLSHLIKKDSYLKDRAKKYNIL